MASPASSTRRRALVLMRDPPHAGIRPRERLDLILMALAFELEVSVAFVGAGVLQLLPRSGPGDPLPDSGAALGSLELYGVSGIYADAEALCAYGIEVDALRVPATALETEELAALLHRQDLLL